MTLINNIIIAASRPFLKEIELTRKDPLGSQRHILDHLLRHGSDTAFGKGHGFGSIRTYEDFARSVPIRDYNAFQPYIDRLRGGEDYVLWDEKTSFFAKSSGTSSDKSKFIPVTPDNLRRCHYSGFRKMLVWYIATHPDSRLFNGKSLTLGGSVQMDEKGNRKIYSGDLSAILLKNSSAVVELSRVPSRSVALIPDFQEKCDRICEECSHLDVTNFAGVPSWNLLLIRKLLEYNHVERLTDIWPHLELFMHGGISFDPYREQYRKLIPSSSMHYLDNYNASEGYFAFQDDLSDRGMMLTLNNGVFFEFVPMSVLDSVLKNGCRDAFPLENVRKGIQYAVVISANSGLWRYLIGDCVEFTSTDPYRIVITGRTQMFINAFGEELMIGNAEQALSEACRVCGLSVSDYSVAPIFMSEEQKGGHQWVVEFSDGEVSDVAGYEHFADVLDNGLCKLNSDYEAKRKETGTMDRLTLTVVPQGTFYRWMLGRGKVGGQNKVPRLCQSRQYVDELMEIIK